MSFLKNLDCQNVEKNEVLTKINFQKWPIFEAKTETYRYFLNNGKSIRTSIRISKLGL